jgi:hypothetical protein
MAAEAPKVAKATMKSLEPGATPITVDFNPVSLTYSVENSTPQQAAQPRRKQFAAQFSGKLTLDLLFDTTDTGADVRTKTRVIAQFMQASAQSRAAAAASDNSSAKAPAQAQPVLSFQWGSYEFRGTMESFRETIDFFSAEGVALRATVSISLARQDQVFDEGTAFSGTQTSGPLVPTSQNDSALSAATRGGDPSAARQLASDNSLENLRFTGGATLQVKSGVQLKAAAGFVSSAPPSAAAGGAGAIAGGGGALFGAKASAGVSASSGAFAGLETGRAKVSTTARLDPSRMLPATVGADVSLYPGASISLGGTANQDSGAGFTADVGVKFSFRDRLSFDDD